MGRPKKEEAQNTKELIIERAAMLFASKGYSATSISMIARGVGIGKSAIYAHFASKEEIIKTIVERYGPSGVVAYVKEIDFEQWRENPTVGFTNFMEQLIDFFTEKNSRLFIDLLRMGCTCFSSQCPHSLQESVGEAKRVGGEIFNRLQQAGLVYTDFPAEFLAWELMAPIIHARIMYFNSASSEAEVEAGIKICQEHIRYFIHNNFVRTK